MRGQDRALLPKWPLMLSRAISALTPDVQRTRKEGDPGRFCWQSTRAPCGAPKLSVSPLPRSPGPSSLGFCGPSCLQQSQSLGHHHRPFQTVLAHVVQKAPRAAFTGRLLVVSSADLPSSTGGRASCFVGSECKVWPLSMKPVLGELLSLFKDSTAEKGFINVSPCDHLGDGN